MRRILPYLLSAVLILPVSGCGSSRDTVEREIQDIRQDQAEAEEFVSKPEASDPDSSAQEMSESDSSTQKQETFGEDARTPSGQDNQTGDGVPVVYMTTDISAEGLMAVYDALGASPSGNIAVKLSVLIRQGIELFHINEVYLQCVRQNVHKDSPAFPCYHTICLRILLLIFSE